MELLQVIQLGSALGGAGLSIYFLKRLVTDFDDFRKEYKLDAKALSVKFVDLNERLVSLSFRIENLQSSIETVKEMLKAQKEDGKELEKKLTLYKEVLSRLISEWKTTQEEIKTIKIELGKNSMMLKAEGDKITKKSR